MKKNIEKMILLPFNLINLCRLFIVEAFLDLISSFKMPKKVIKLFHIVWPYLKPYLKPFIQAMIIISKKVTSQPFMRAMSTVDQKRIRVMYLMFRLFTRIMRV